MTGNAEIAFGDTVRVRHTADTEAAGFANSSGQCFGFTKPSYSQIEVVGELSGDVAYNVDFDDGRSAWFAPELLEVVDHGAGTEITIGDASFVRDDDGEWRRHE